MSDHTNFSSIGPAVWPGISNIYIYTNVLFYYIDFISKKYSSLAKSTIKDLKLLQILHQSS